MDLKASFIKVKESYRPFSL